MKPKVVFHDAISHVCENRGKNIKAKRKENHHFERFTLDFEVFDFAVLKYSASYDAVAASSSGLLLPYLFHTSWQRSSMRLSPPASRLR